MGQPGGCTDRKICLIYCRDGQLTKYPDEGARPYRGIMSLPPQLQEIVDDFATMSREEKLETLIAYAESMPPLPDRFAEERDKMEEVPECMTPVCLFGEKDANDRISSYIDIPPQS